MLDKNFIIGFFENMRMPIIEMETFKCVHHRGEGPRERKGRYLFCPYWL
jgi:hypothetical protein